MKNHAAAKTAALTADAIPRPRVNSVREINETDTFAQKR